MKLHHVLSLTQITFGLTLLVAPNFAFSGALGRLGYVAVAAYAMWFVVFAAPMVWRRPRSFMLYMVHLLPLLFHYSANIARVAASAVWSLVHVFTPWGPDGGFTLLPVIPLYGFPLVIFVWLIRRGYQDE